MPDYEITSRTDGRFNVRVGNCTLEHARSVLDQLLVEPTVPSDLVMAEVGVPAPKQPWFRRFF